MGNLAAVIFDIDGTLVDSVDLHAEAWQRTFRKFGHEIRLPDIRIQIGKGGDQLLPVFLDPEEMSRRGEDISAERDRLFQSELLQTVKPFPGVRDLFERVVSQGLKIALASSARKDELNHYVQLLEVEDLIESGTSTDDASKSKPHPDIFEAALKKLGGLPADAAIAIGDTPYDAEAAAKAGMKTIGVLCGGFAEADLRAAGAVAVYRDPADLLAHFAESPLATG